MFSHVRNIFFDFDGVILDSVDCKTQAFENMYSKYGNDITKKVKKYHLDNGGVSRFEKFRFWHKEYLGISLNEDEISNFADADTVPIPTLAEFFWINIIDSLVSPFINCTSSVLPTVCNLMEPVISKLSAVRNIEPDAGTILIFLAIYFRLK